MLTTAITAALAALLTSLGVEPGLYVAPMWVAVKVIIVTPLVGGGMLVMKRRADEEARRAAAEGVAVVADAQPAVVTIPREGA